MEKQDLLLLHGALGSRSQFQGLIPLLEPDFEIYTLDFSGHGDMPPQTEFGIITFANEVLDELARWDIDKINVFGYSMGGYIACYLALNSTRIIKAFTLGTKFLWTPEYAAFETRKLNPEKILEKVPAYAEELRLRHRSLDWQLLLEKTSRMMTDLGYFNLLTADRIAEIEKQICIGLGELDNTVDIDETIAVYKSMPNGRLCVLPNTTHPLEKVNPVLLAQAIRQHFIEE